MLALIHNKTIGGRLHMKKLVKKANMYFFDTEDAHFSDMVWYYGMFGIAAVGMVIGIVSTLAVKFL